MYSISGFVAFSVTLLGVLVTVSGQAAADNVDDFVAGEMRARKIPGLAISVLRGDQVLKTSVYGFANSELNVPVTLDTSFSLASLSKEITSVAIMALAERKLLSIDDPAIKYLPDLPPMWREVTIRQLLSHTSGLPDAINDDVNYTAVAGEWNDALSILAKATISVPGASTAYNQMGYAILGKIIERISNEDFIHHIEKYLFERQGMTNSVYGDAWERIPGRSELYTALAPTPDRTKLKINNGRPSISDDVLRYGHKVFPSWLNSAVGLNASISDLTKWEAALISGRIISNESLETMTAPTPLRDGKLGLYGLGFIVGTLGNQKIVLSGGGAAVWCFRSWDEKLTVIVLTNLQGSSPEKLATEIAKFYSKPHQ